jgi:hypothetical protein
MTKTFVYLFFICLFPLSSYSQIDPQVQDIINQVNLDSLAEFVGELSGEVSIYVNGQPVTIYSRHTDYPGNELAAGYISQKLESYGLTPEYLTYSADGKDVFAVQPGTDYPDQKYIICAHYDSMPDSSVAPGADDNASGTAAVLEAARILTQYTTKYTIIYAFWDEEEQGVLGSAAWANYAFDHQWIIPGVINIDMIGWDSDNDGKFWVNTRDIGSSVMVADKIVEINQLYQLGLDPQVLNPGSGSDNLPFWYYGYSAVGVEELYGIDWNDYYHTTEDKLDKFNLPFFHGCAKIVIGTLASLAEVNSSAAVEPEEIIPDVIELAQNYPNPFNPSTRISYQLPARTYVTLSVYNLLGNEIKTLVNEEQSSGSYTVDFNAGSLAGGVYFCRLNAGSYSVTKKMILVK